MTSNTQQKYRLAVSWCEVNRKLLKKNSKIRLLTSENLYLLMETLGMYWSKREGAWLNRGTVSADAPQQDMQRQVADTVSGRTLIRIIAHKDTIQRRAAEFTEFCELLNWRVIKVSDVIGDGAGDFVRVYITVMVDENRDL